MPSTISVIEKSNISTLKSEKLLDLSAKTWFIVATIGQGLFLTYLFGFYGKATLQGDFARWNKVLPHGYVEGDFTGNLVMGLHLFFAAIMILGGPLQLMPQVRNRFPRFHRYVGRTYVFTAILISLDGLTMVWTRGSVGDMLQHISISIQAIYIIGFAILSIYYARKKDFVRHRVWALCLYMVVNGVWFFRLGLMFWIFVNQGPAGFDPDTFTGPFLTFLSIFTYVLPISIGFLALYLKAKSTPLSIFKYFTASLIFIATLVMSVGIFAATLILWLPRVK